MTEPPIPAPLRDFILRNIDSVAELEALLLVRREPLVAWDASLAARRLYVDESAAADVLERLCAKGLIGNDGALFRYAGQAEDVRRTVDELAECYTRRLIAVTNLIHGKPARIRQFADAFRIKREK